jgi:IPT/TIG domain
MNPSAVLDVDEAIIAVDLLQLQDGTELRIANNVKYLTILARSITIGDNTSITWESLVPPDPGMPVPLVDGTGTSHSRTQVCAHSTYYAADGGAGDDYPTASATGNPGDDAPTVEIWSLDAVALPTFELKGGEGGIGQHGGDGGDGGHGAKGSDSFAVIACVDQPGYGGDGGGGAGRDGGQGGPGGQGGLGGEAGDAHFGCSARPERAGDNADDGEDGDTGPKGRAGVLFADGESPNFSAIVITEDDFRTKWFAPQIRTVDPFQAEVGDTLTLLGANFTSAAVVSIGGVDVDTTFFADTTLQADVPPIASGVHHVLVAIPGGEMSNPASLEVLPSLSAATPNPAAVGMQITLTGSGFVSGCNVMFQGIQLPPDSVSSDGTQVQFTIPQRTAPFEDFGGVHAVFVRNPDGSDSPSIDLELRHVLSTGFDVTQNGYAFLNQLPIAGVADLGTFTETYGIVDATLETVTHPGRTAAYFAAYLLFFNERTPGYSSGFAMTAIDAYWSGTPPVLFNAYSSLPQAERLLTVAQGHILSEEVLTELGFQAATGVARADISLNEIEEVFRRQRGLGSDEERRLIAPVMQLMPAGLPVTLDFFNKLANSHGLLPIRIEYPLPGDAWEKRLVVYDNAQPVGVGLETNIDFTRNGDTLDFVIEHLGSISPTIDARGSASGWTLSHLSLDFCWLMNVSMPINGVFLLSAGRLLIEDDSGRRYGVSGRRAFGDLPGVVPGVGVENLYLLPLDQDLTFTISGAEENDAATYTLGIVAGRLGRSMMIGDVPIGRATSDVVRIADNLREVAIESNDADKQVVVRYALEGIDEARSVALEGARIGPGGGLTLRVSDNLTSFDIESAQPERPVTVALGAAGADGEQLQRFVSVPIGGGRSNGFTVDGWGQLGPQSLKAWQPSPTR